MPSWNPFVGSGAVFFDLQGRGLLEGHGVTISDDNADLIGCYLRIGDSLEEVWLENGRFITDASTALAVRVLDVKQREDSRYLICDGGRTNVSYL